MKSFQEFITEGNIKVHQLGDSSIHGELGFEHTDKVYKKTSASDNNGRGGGGNKIHEFQFKSYADADKHAKNLNDRSFGWKPEWKAKSHDQKAQDRGYTDHEDYVRSTFMKKPK